jgi:hypothetical protein
MATIFNWLVTTMDCLPQTPEGADYVVVVHWTCSGTDGTYNGSVYSTCSLPVVDSGNFIPYQSLTEQTVLGWCWANGVDKDATEAAVEQQIQNAKNPPVVSLPLPWQSQ